MEVTVHLYTAGMQSTPSFSVVFAESGCRLAQIAAIQSKFVLVLPEKLFFSALSAVSSYQWSGFTSSPHLREGLQEVNNAGNSRDWCPMGR
jgi:uncharacterized transporter YbjL